MSKVHPAESKWQNAWLKERSVISKQRELYSRCDHRGGDQDPTVLTVWKRSSMSFQGTDGFTVFDQRGKLAFRVDNYSRKNSCGKGGLLLMDGAGKALLTLKPQVFSFQHQWNAYEGEQGSPKMSGHKSSKVFTMTKPNRRSTLFQNPTAKTAEAEVFLENPRRETDNVIADFRIEGCFWRRSCKIMSGGGGGNGEAAVVVAEISRKRVNNDRVVLGDDVFSLVVKPGFDAQLVMAFVVVLDRICVKPYSPVLCS